MGGATEKKVQGTIACRLPYNDIVKERWVQMLTIGLNVARLQYCLEDPRSPLAALPRGIVSHHDFLACRVISMQDQNPKDPLSGLFRSFHQFKLLDEMSNNVQTGSK